MSKRMRQIFSLTRGSLLLLIGLAYVVRLIMMPITGQYDVLFMPWMTQYLTLSSPNIYENLYQEFGDIVLREPAVWAPYPYGYYIVTSFWTSIIRLLSEDGLSNWHWAWGVAYPARQVFYFKLLYLLFDCLILYTLYTKVGRIAGILWAWSPVAIYTPFMMGQNDVYATACTVVAIWAMVRYSSQALSAAPQHTTAKWARTSSVMLGIGAAFKIYPLLLLIPLLLAVTLSWKQRILCAIIGTGTFLSVVVPFLSTSTFVDGVLFNPEGSQLFRRVEVLGIDLPMFMLSYCALILALLIFQKPRSYGASPWFVALMVLALLFLWVPTPLYWLIWITPIVAAAVYFKREMWPVWGLVQSGFILSLTGLHKELGVALPIHLSEYFNMPNLSTALTLVYPSAARIYDAIQPVFGSMLTASMILMLVIASRKIWAKSADGDKEKYTPLNDRTKSYVALSLGPTVAMFVLLGINLYAGRHLVTKNSWLDWQPYQISASKPLIQEISANDQEIHGVRIKLDSVSSPSEINLCIFGDGLVQEELIQCTTSTTNRLVEDNQLYLRFTEPFVAEQDANLGIRVEANSLNRTDTSSGIVAVLVSLDQNSGKILLESGVTQGTANVSTLSGFRFIEVVDKWLISNVFGDKQLPIAISSVLIGVLGFIFILVTRPSSQPN